MGGAGGAEAAGGSGADAGAASGAGLGAAEEAAAVSAADWGAEEEEDGGAEAEVEADAAKRRVKTRAKAARSGATGAVRQAGRRTNVLRSALETGLKYNTQD